MMMDKNYILENGILELYVLGELSEQECLQVEQLLKTDNDLKQYFETLEKNFEALAIDNAIAPPEAFKEKLLHKVSPKVIKLPYTKYKTYSGIAASIALLMAIASIWFFVELKTAKSTLELVEEEKKELNNTLKTLETQLTETNRWFEAINNPDSKQYILTGNTLAPNAKVISYVNHNNKTVLVNTKTLPKLDANHDYQMWADVEGEMINMGILNKETDLLAMTYIDNAESLNITIEPAGGNDHPTVAQLIGNVYLNP